MKKVVPTFDKTVPKNLPLLFQVRAQQCENVIAQAAKDANGTFQYYTFKQVYNDIITFAIALRDKGIKRGDHVALISDNRREWLIADLAILSLGAADVPRGSDSMGNEIRFIVSFADCEYGIFENSRQLEKVLEKPDEISCMKTAIMFDTIKEETAQKAKQAGITVYQFSDLAAKGREILKNDPHCKAEIEAEMQMTDGEEIATLIFTSGTTGTPKGVMLSHRNFLAQMEVMHNCLPVKEGDMWLTVLPVWHVFERAIQYVAITLKSGLAYSKPVAAIMLPDMATIKPQWMCGVPRLWESLYTGVNRSMKKAGGIKYAMFRFFVGTGKKYAWAKEHITGCVCQFTKRWRFLDVLVGIIPFILLWPLAKLGDVLVYSKVREKLGGKFVAAISGGGALQKDIDAFYRAINFKLLEGYGMTETAPILSVRSYIKPRPGCVGVIIPCVDIKIVQEKHGEIMSKDPLPPGKRGLILAKGDQIMKGYYKRPDLTAQILDEDGWLNTGDLGMLTWDNEIKITGRAKDTIVLLGGENVEPTFVEGGLKSSEFIESAVVLGQDKKYLAALIVPAKDMIEAWARENGIANEFYEGILETPEVQNLIRNEIDTHVSADAGFRTCERIFKFGLLSQSFQIGEELSAKQEMMRHKINQKYKKEIEALFD